MGRLITFLGFLLLIGGIGGMVMSSVSGFNFGNLASLGASPTTDQLCESGDIRRARAMPARCSIFVRRRLACGAMSRPVL
jgi:hypothetical protein